VTDRQGFAERLGRLPSSSWFAYPAVLLVQACALGAWAVPVRRDTRSFA